VALDADKKIINAFSGHPDAAHRQGCAWVKNRGVVKRQIGDIVITQTEDIRSTRIFINP